MPLAVSPAALTALTTWGARLAWIVTAVVGGTAIGDAVADRSDAVQLAATAGAWLGWGVGAVALAVPSVVTLTLARAVVPGALLVAAATAIFGADPGNVLALTVPAVVAAVLVGAAETGRAWVQASAYGDEQRFPLRPPLGYLAACAGSWAVAATAAIATPVAWAAGAFAVAVPATLVAGVGAWLLPRRWHQLSRRWLVLVPAGVVVHDPVVLGETFMLRRDQVAGITLADLGPGVAAEAADLTGPTPGLAVEVTLTEAATVLFAPRPAIPRGRAIHVLAFLVSPTRPGAVLTDARRRRLPVEPG